MLPSTPGAGDGDGDGLGDGLQRNQQQTMHKWSEVQITSHAASVATRLWLLDSIATTHTGIKCCCCRPVSYLTSAQGWETGSLVVTVTAAALGWVTAAAVMVMQGV
jgi:hypothetical protein